jgi:hypothetical protein
MTALEFVSYIPVSRSLCRMLGVDPMPYAELIAE